MTIYFSTDIQTTDDGDIVLDTFGDIKIAEPIRTVAQSINNLILTNKGDLLTDLSFGADITKYYGERNTQYNRTLMEQDILGGIRSQGIIDINDAEVDVVSLDVDKVSIIVSVKGTFFKYNATGVFKEIVTSRDDDILMAYTYPFTNNQLTRIQ